MLINRIDFEAVIISQTEISVGQGTEHVDVENNDGPNGEHVQKQQRLLARGVDGQYIIPVSSLKGALRSHHSQDDTFCKRVFGHVDHTGGSVGAQGRLELDDAVAITAVQQVSRKGTAINRQRGAADINKLFDRTFLPAGSKFTFTGRMFYRGEDASAALEDLRALVDPFLNVNGLAVGSGSRMGFGSLKLHCDVKYGDVVFDPDSGIFPDTVERTKKLDLDGEYQSAEPWAKLTFTLTSETPFIVIDEASGDRGDDGAQIKPLKIDGGAYLPTTSFIGALRAHCAYLEELTALRAQPNEGAQEHTMADNRFLEGKLDGGVKRHADIAELTPMERLFGVSGFKGLLEIHAFKRETKGACVSIQQVSMDRFTGGVRHGATFATEAFLSPGWTITLAIDAARADRVYCGDREGLKAKDTATLQRLISTLNEDPTPLFLGHGAAKGFGWFDVTCSLSYHTEAP